MGTETKPTHLGTNESNEIITRSSHQISNDIGMKFGQSKCSYIVVERQKVTAATEPTGA